MSTLGGIVDGKIAHTGGVLNKKQDKIPLFYLCFLILKRIYSNSDKILNRDINKINNRLREC